MLISGVLYQSCHYIGYHTDSMPIVDMSSNASSCTITADLLNWHLSFGLLRLAPQCLHFNKLKIICMQCRSQPRRSMVSL